MKIAFILCLYFILFFVPGILILVWLEGKSEVERLDNIRKILLPSRGGNAYDRRQACRNLERASKLSKA